MKIVKTAKGKMVDMASLIKANEQARAVGNIPMNARGDRLDKKGNVIATVQRVARTQHNNMSASKTVKMSDVPSAVAKPTEKVKPEPRELMIISDVVKDRSDGTQYREIEFDDGSIEIEEIKDNNK